MLYRMPGGRIEFSSAADAITGYPVAAKLILGGASRMMRVARTGDRSALSHTMRTWANHVIHRLGIDLEMRGLDKIPTGEQLVVAPLHESFIDVAAILHLPLQLRFSARQELSRWRVLGRVLEATGQIVVDTDRPRSGYRQLLRGAEEADRVGESVVVFPQGSVLGVEVAFQRGTAGVARHLGRRILPVVLTGGHRVWDYPFSPTVRFGQVVTAEVLPPVTPDAFSGLERHMKSLALSDGRAPARRFVPDRDGFWDGYDYEIDPMFERLAAEVAAHRVE